MPFRNLLEESHSLTELDVLRLGELVAEWQLLADISFADLVLWIPRRQDERAGLKDISQLPTFVR